MTILYNLIDSDFGLEGRGRWFRSKEHTSLVYDAEKDVFFWNSQQKSGTALDYLIEIRGMAARQARKFLDGQYPLSINTPVLSNKGDYLPYDKLVDVMWANGKNNRDYWYRRCIKDATIDRRRLGYYDGWSMIPLEIGGKLENFQMRRDEPDKKIRYWYTGAQPVLMSSELLGLVDTIYITEGTVDSLLLNQEGLPSVAHSGGSGYWNDLWFPLFSRIKTIYYIADNDKAGAWAAKRISKSLGEDKVLIYNFDTDKEKYDTVDFFRDGGTIEELKNLIHTNSKHGFEIGDDNGSFKFAAGGRRKGRFARAFTKSY